MTSALTGIRYAVAVAASLAVLIALATGSTGNTGRGATPSEGTTATGTTTATTTASTTPSAPEGDGEPISFDEPVEDNPVALGSFYDQRVSWKACGDDRCAAVKVPVDYDEPDRASVAIALRMVPAAQPARRKGTLFINPGGPGESGLEFAEEARSFFDPSVLDVWDVVGFDPRGLGKSGGFRCLSDRDLDTLYASDPTPETAAEKAALRKQAAERWAGCRSRGGALAEHMGTEQVARDLDILREAVGDERLNYYGVSYGTLIGATYADQFTSRVGLVVLDSAVDPDGADSSVPDQQDVDGAAASSAYAFDDVFDDFVQACLDEGDCPLGTDTRAASATLVRFLDRLEKAPMDTTYETLPRLTEGWVAAAISLGLHDEESWPYLVDGLRDALRDGDPDELSWFAMVSVSREDDGTYPETSFERDNLPITCADWPESPWDAAVPTASLSQTHPLWARVDQVAVSACAGWEVETRHQPLVDAELDTPIVVIGNQDDLVTPIEDTEYLSDLLSGSRFVSVDAQGHGSYGGVNGCADRVVDRYLADALAPDDGLVCAAE